MLAATIGGVRYVNVYVPNGHAVGADKYEYKLHWLRSVRRFLQGELAGHEKPVVKGGFNITVECAGQRGFRTVITNPPSISLMFTGAIPLDSQTVWSVASAQVCRA